MAKKVYEESKIAAIAARIREKAGGDVRYTTADMPGGVDLVNEAGKQAERSRLWGEFQDYGGERSYYYAFTYNRFTDSTYNPQYDIVCQSDATTSSQYLFYNTTKITDTKVPIFLNGRNAGYAFYGCNGLIRIPKIAVHEALTYNNTFTGCLNLEELGVEGVVGQDISFKDCVKLNKPSISNVMTVLSDTTTGKTLTLSQAAVEAAFPLEELLAFSNKIEERDGFRFVWNSDGRITLNGIADKDVTLVLETPPCEVESDIYTLSVKGYTGDNCTYVVGSNYVSSNAGGGGMSYPIEKGEVASIWITINQGTILNNAVITPSISHRAGGWGKLVNDKPNWTISLV